MTSTTRLSARQQLFYDTLVRHGATPSPDQAARFRKALEFVTAYPELHNQRTWAAPLHIMASSRPRQIVGVAEATASCGTVACLAGWHAILSDVPIIVGVGSNGYTTLADPELEHLNHDADGHSDGAGVARWAQADLGLHDWDITIRGHVPHPFSSHNTADDLADWAMAIEARAADLAATG